MTTKIALAFALAIAALASVPASASPDHDWQVAGNCQEDLGYGRTSDGAAARPSPVLHIYPLTHLNGE
jgi:hypothetical protein